MDGSLATGHRLSCPIAAQRSTSKPFPGKPLVGFPCRDKPASAASAGALKALGFPTKSGRDVQRRPVAANEGLGAKLYQGNWFGPGLDIGQDRTRGTKLIANFIAKIGLVRRAVIARWKGSRRHAKVPSRKARKGRDSLGNSAASGILTSNVRVE
jgi:hypothetical protein